VEGCRQGIGCQAKAILRELDRYSPQAIRLSQPRLKITIGHACRGIGSLLPGQVYVGRPSPLGNPYALGRDGSREQVIAQRTGAPPCRAMRRWCARRFFGWRGRRGAEYWPPCRLRRRE
jgi:hypothetical protein